MTETTKRDKIWLSPSEAAEHTGISERQLQRWRTQGGGPPWSRPAARLVRYRIVDLDAWLGARVVADGSAQ